MSLSFDFTKEQEQLRGQVRHFVTKHVAPNAAAWDREERFPLEIVAPLGELGAWGVNVESRFGGKAWGSTELALFTEEIACVDGSLALTVASHNGLCSGHIHMFGSTDQKATFLPYLATGKKLGAWGLTEPNSGSDAASMGAFAKRDGKGWILNGSKIFITQGSVGEVFVILARTDQSQKAHGVTAFIVEKNTPGFTQQPMKDKLGMRSSDTALLNFENVAIPDSHRIGNENEGFIQSLKILDKGRITIGALSLGLGRGAYEFVQRQVLEMKRRGASHAPSQSTLCKLANMAAELDAASLLVYRAAWLCDTGALFSQQAAIAKLFASEVAMRVTDDAIQIMGAAGCTKDSMLERHYRDAKLCTIGEGTNEVLRLLIGKNLLKEISA